MDARRIGNGVIRFVRFDSVFHGIVVAVIRVKEVRA